MITEDFWASWAAIWLLSGPILLGYVGFFYSLYLNRRYLDEMIEALKNSRYIYIWEPSMRYRGWISSCLVMAKIAQMIIWPKSSLHLGELDPVDLKNFPAHLKRSLKIQTAIMMCGGAWLVIVFVLMRFK